MTDKLDKLKIRYSDLLNVLTYDMNLEGKDLAKLANRLEKVYLDAKSLHK